MYRLELKRPRVPKVDKEDLYTCLAMWSNLDWEFCTAVQKPISLSFGWYIIVKWGKCYSCFPHRKQAVETDTHLLKLWTFKDKEGILRPVGRKKKQTISKKGNIKLVSDFCKAGFSAKRLQRNAYWLLNLEQSVLHYIYSMYKSMQV